ncbi:dipeptidase PepV [Clostridium sp.]|uniref:dipeptidase PepV n=1 Tax=Clostridium sp. TaxID=1506 RepID=UPI003217CBA4
MFKKYIEENKSNIINDLVELVKIRTVEGNKKPNMPFGEEVYKGLRYVIDKGTELGFKSQNFCGYCGHIEAGSGEYTVGILCHVDVVSEGYGWTKDPFEGEICDGKIYGRGAINGKGPMISCLYAMKLLQDENLIPKDKRVRLIVGGDRETNLKSIDYYKEYEKAPDIGFTTEGKFPIIYGEKGIIDMDINMELLSDFDAPINIVEIIGGETSNMVPSRANFILSCTETFREKVEVELKGFAKREKIKYKIFVQNRLMSIEFIGRESLGSTPENGINAISYGMKFLLTFEEFIDKKEFVQEYNRLISTYYNGEKIDCNFKDEDSGKFTFNVGVINLTNDNVNIKVNIRYPISYIYSDVLQRIKDGFKYSPLKLSNINHVRPVSFSRDSFIIKKLMKTYRDVTGDKVNEPYVTSEDTYARAMSNTVSFGPVFPLDEDLSHKPDEFISIDSLMKITEIYAMAIYQLLK